jgi:hypothetical protein
MYFREDVLRATQARDKETDDSPDSKANGEAAADRAAADRAAEAAADRDFNTSPACHYGLDPQSPVPALTQTHRAGFIK